MIGIWINFYSKKVLHKRIRKTTLECFCKSFFWIFWIGCDLLDQFRFLGQVSFPSQVPAAAAGRAKDKGAEGRERREVPAAAGAAAAPDRLEHGGATLLPKNIEYSSSGSPIGTISTWSTL